MSENDFYSNQGNQYRGSRFPSFSSGALDSQGNFQSAAQADNPGAVEGSVSSKPVSSGLTDVGSIPGIDIPKVPSVGKQVATLGASIAAPYAGKIIGETAGTALANGATASQAFRQGGSALYDKVGGLLSSSSSGAATGGTAAAGGTAASTAASNTGAAAVGSAGSTAASAASPSTFASRFTAGSNLGAAGGVGVGTAVVGLLTGQKPAFAIGSGIGSAAGFAIGNAIAPGIGGFIGSAIGGAVSKPIGNVVKGIGKALGSVICSELVRQDLLSLKMARIARIYRITRYTKTHYNGYMFWAPTVVRLMQRDDRVGRAVTKVALYLIGGWVNQMAYEVGELPKPCLRGKVTAAIVSPICFVIGALVSNKTIEARKDYDHVASAA